MEDKGKEEEGSFDCSIYNIRMSNDLTQENTLRTNMMDWTGAGTPPKKRNENE